MPDLIFNTRAEYDAFEAKMAAREGLPKPGRNALTGEIVDPGRKTGKGWTTRVTDPSLERAGTRVLARVQSSVALDPVDAARIETRRAEKAKFGPLDKR